MIVRGNAKLGPARLVALSPRLPTGGAIDGWRQSPRTSARVRIPVGSTAEIVAVAPGTRQATPADRALRAVGRQAGSGGGQPPEGGL